MADSTQLQPLPEEEATKISWFVPIVLTTSFLSVLCGLLLVLHSSRKAGRLAELHEDAKEIAEAIGIHLNGNREYLLLLAEEMSRGELDEDSFQQRATQFVVDHPELVNITWADEEFIIRWTAPYEPNKQVLNLKLTLPEPERASREARDTKRPVYTRPFEVIQGGAAFEVYVPVFRANEFLGTFGGVYSIENVLQYTASKSILEEHHLAFSGKSGNVLVSLSPGRPIEKRLSAQIPLDPPGYGTSLVISHYARQVPWGAAALALISITLALGMVWSIWSSRKELTERRRIGQQLQRSYDRFRTVMDSLDALVYVADMDTYEIMFINKYGREIWGDIVGETCWKTLQSGQTGPCPFCTNDKLLNKAGEPAPPHVWEFRNTVDREWYECHDQAIRWTDGRLVRLEIATNITERRRAEEQRRNVEGQVQQAQKYKSLGVLAGGIAHDFNNLLMAILGNTELALQDLTEGSPAKQWIVEIERASQRAADLVQQILAYSGRKQFDTDKIDLSETIRHMARLLKTSISRKLSLRLNLAQDLPAIEADSAQMQQLVLSLVTNASEAHREDEEGEIGVSTGVMHCSREDLAQCYFDEHLPEAEYVYVEVADTGCGMDEETKARIFDPFFTTRFVGRGMGLAAVLGIVRGHNGTVMVDTSPGEGTVFRVLLPALGERVERSAEERAFPVSEGWRGSGTVLLIDDEDPVRALGKTVLERFGFTVLLAAGGREGVEVFREHAEEIACVLLDLTMPDMNGEETFQALLRIRSDIRVILCSGYNEEEVAWRFSGKGLAGFIQKPYRSANLAAMLCQILGEVRT